MEKDSTVWEEDRIRFVGFMDVMGFKDMIARKSHDEVKQMLLQMSYMKDILQKVVVSPFEDRRNNKREQRIRSVTFSDSVLFVTRDDSFDDLFTLATVLAIFQEAAIQRGAPTKGAISVGKLTANFDKSIFFGQPLIDAYQLQDEVFYYGVILDNKVESKIIEGLRNKQLNKELIESHFIKLQTPLKSGKINHYNIKLDSLTEDQLEDMYKGVSGSVRKYVDNTIEMYELMQKKKKA